MRAKRDQDFFWEAIDRGDFQAQKCLACGTLRHPPSPICARCGSGEWVGQSLSGRGTIHSWLFCRHPINPDSASRLVVLVDLEEGLRFISNLLDTENAKVGAPVALEFGEVNGQRLPLFRTVGTAGS
jgi:uncharacterized OB-fold protein